MSEPKTATSTPKKGNPIVTLLLVLFLVAVIVAVIGFTQKDAANKALNTIKTDLTTAQGAQKTAEDALAAIQQELDAAKGAAQTAVDEKAGVQALLDTATADLKTAQDALADLQPKLDAATKDLSDTQLAKTAAEDAQKLAEEGKTAAEDAKAQLEKDLEAANLKATELENKVNELTAAAEKDVDAGIEQAKVDAQKIEWEASKTVLLGLQESVNALPDVSTLDDLKTKLQTAIDELTAKIDALAK